jgi:hypothetical protein
MPWWQCFEWHIQGPARRAMSSCSAPCWRQTDCISREFYPDPISPFCDSCTSWPPMAGPAASADPLTLSELPTWQPLSVRRRIFCSPSAFVLSSFVRPRCDGSILSQIRVSIAGKAIMCLAADAAAWFKVSGDGKRNARRRLQRWMHENRSALAGRNGRASLPAATDALPMSDCRAKPKFLDVGAPLTKARQAIAEHKKLSILTISSSTTESYGASNPAYPNPAH